MSGRGLQGAIYRPREGAWQVTAPALERVEPSADPPRRCRRRGAAHGVGATERLVEHERQRVEIGRLERLAALALLGGHVRERPHHIAGARENVFPREACATEVGQLGDGVRLRAPVARSGRDEHVLRLDIAMDDAPGVRVLQRT